MEDKNELEYKEQQIASVLTQKQQAEALAFCENCKVFLKNGKTEREAAKFIVAAAGKAGFKEWNGTPVKAGEKVYFINRKKSVVLVKAGTADIEQGINLIIAHIDSPRLDLKPKPLYEDGGMALLKTHYYGGIKKYQWTTTPLAIHGVVIKKDGTPAEVKIGEDEGDPVFCITDLLPHLSRNQDQKKLSEGIEGEGLNVLIGSLPIKKEGKAGDKDKEDSKEAAGIKQNILKLLNSKYGITERDLVTAELEIVPAFKAKDVGLDLSMLGSYGLDDHICAYPSLMSVLELKNNKKTAVLILADKEEIGCEGITAPTPLFIRDLIADIAGKDKNIRKVLAGSACMSADVTAAFDPNYADAYEKRNSSILGYGVSVEKYGGARGKGGSSDASAEFVSKICTMLDDNKVIWQTGELGKIDLGGGGTFASEVAHAGVEVIDVGVPILSMHSPFEVASKMDIYMTYLAYSKFLEKF